MNILFYAKIKNLHHCCLFTSVRIFDVLILHFDFILFYGDSCYPPLQTLTKKVTNTPVPYRLFFERSHTPNAYFKMRDTTF